MVARDPEKLQSVRQLIEAGQPDARLATATLDLADLESVREGAASILARHPRIDRLINNAGVSGSYPDLLSREVWETQMSINATGTFLCTQAFVPAMIESGWGRVVNIASIAAGTSAWGRPGPTRSPSEAYSSDEPPSVS